MLWFYWLLCHINHRKLFNANSSLYIYIYIYIYIKCIGFGLIWFYGTSTSVGYSLPNPLDKYSPMQKFLLDRLFFK